MATQKNPVLVRLFEKKGCGIITLEDVDATIREINAEVGSTLSTKNVANFYKDYTRVTRLANSNWPDYLRQRRVTARKADKAGQCFEFIKWPNDQDDPFLDTIAPNLNTTKEVVSISISDRFRRCACKDESYIASFVDKVGLFNIFLKTISIDQVETVHFGKKARAEIDVIICGRDITSGRDILVAVEVKTHSESIGMGQLLAQSAACSKMAIEKNIDAYYMVAMKPIRTPDGGCGIFMCASQKIHSKQHDEELRFCDGIVYELDNPILPMVGIDRL